MKTLANQFAERGPWITSFVVNGQVYGGGYDAENDGRFPEFRKRYPHPRRVLELGCLEGGHTIPLARRAGEVVAIDSRADNIQKAEFVRDLYDLQNITFITADLESYPLESLGIFDVVFNVGLLYHLPEPWKLLEQIAPLTKHMFLWTHVAPAKWWYSNRGGYKGMIYAEGGVPDPLSGMSQTSFWPTEKELVRMLEDSGFMNVDVIDVDRQHKHGPAILLACDSRVTANAELQSVAGGVS